MSNPTSPERDAEHPLFRVLVLMGGSLALGCGGSAVIDAGPGGSGGARAVGGAGQGGVAQGSSGAQGGAGAIAGAIAITIGGGGSGVVDAGPPDCPTAQWDCSGLGVVCEPNLGNAGRPAGCVCDPKRPRSVADCAANEDLICERAYTGEPDPSTWDTSTHIQCACVPGPPVPSYETCGTVCAKTYNGLTAQGNASCSLPQGTMCDPYGNNCTATAANVLRQDGIVCGCAPVVLK